MQPSITLDDAKVHAAMTRLRQLVGGRGGGALSIMQSIGRYMKTSTQMRFRTQAGPDGTPWTPSARAQAEGGQTLRDSNRLFRSLSWHATSQYAEAGTNVVYGPAHHFGIREMVNIPSHRRTRRKTSRTGRLSVSSWTVRSYARAMFLPARPFVGFSQADRIEILAILREGIAALARP
ncbi:phage virion morphogenesis protein [Pseudoxanthomonas sp. UTMC 1351]|uniref:phage virion morphogenesis protein n=1 Tax=Pseudoxanthomonas sp. UTMC 1351 TaxID=2695853 RepID=UPI0034CDD20F